MNILFFDCESTGFSRDARMISIAWILADHAGAPINESHHLVRPDGWTVPAEKFWIDNGFSQDKNMREGVTIDFVLEDFMTVVHNAAALVSHNIPFDLRILNYELILSGRMLPNSILTFCTMEGSKQYCRLPQPGKTGFKKPTLSELYRHLFNKDIAGRHNALGDTRACMESFYELVKRGAVKLSTTPVTQ